MIAKAKQSTASPKQLASLLEMGLIAPKPRSLKIKAFASAFGVLKKNGLLRYVMSNQISKQHEYDLQMKLQQPFELIDSFMVPGHQFVFTADATSFFSQLSIPMGVSAYFVLKFGSKFFVPLVLPQGWRFSPAIAQTMALIAIRENRSASVHIDNFILTACSHDAILKERDIFLRRCLDAGIHLKEPVPPIVSETVYVGIQLCFVTSRWRLDPSWIDKVEPFLRRFLFSDDWHSVREWWQVMGYLIWGLQVLRVELARLDPALQWFSAVAKLIYIHSDCWNLRVKMTSIALNCARHCASLVLTNPWRSLVLPHRMVSVCTDASLTGGAFVIFMKEQQLPCAWPWIGPLSGVPYESRGIFWLELFTVHRAIISVLDLCEDVDIWIWSDNRGVVDGFRRGLFHHPLANFLLTDVKQRALARQSTFRLLHVSTKFNIADKWSRLVWSTWIH